MFVLYIISVINGLVVGGCHFQTFWVGLKPVKSNIQEISVFIGKIGDFSPIFSHPIFPS